MPPTEHQPIEQPTGNSTQIESLLKEQLILARDTNTVVRSMRRAFRIAFWAKLILWTLVIVLPFLFIGPILKTLIPGAGANGISIFGIPSPAQIENIVHTIQNNVSR